MREYTFEQHIIHAHLWAWGCYIIVYVMATSVVWEIIPLEWEYLRFVELAAIGLSIYYELSDLFGAKED